MSSSVLTICIMAGLGVVAVRRRSTALILVTLQSLLLAGIALWRSGGDPAQLLACGGLALRAIAIAAILGVGIIRSRETGPIRTGIEPMARVAIAAALLLTIPPLVPPLGSGDTNGLRAAVALGVLGIVIAMTRRATILQVLGIVVAENGATLAALSATSSVPIVIDLGVVFDLLLIASVATAFHSRMFNEFGSGDTAHLRELRD